MHCVIDIGSNTIRLAMYEVKNREISLMFNKKSTAGLASYINKTGKMSQKGIDKAISVLNDFKKIINKIKPLNVYVFATASLRNITNSSEAVNEISQKTGFKIDLISGDNEGIYDYAGVSLRTELKDGILVDIGGGSTELVLFVDSVIKKSISFPIGSLVLYKKFVEGIVPTETEIKKMKKFIKETFDSVEGMNDYKLICCVGGTGRATCLLSNQLFDKPAETFTLNMKNINDIIELYTTDTKKISKKILKIAPDRIHTIIPGMLILQSLGQKFDSFNVRVSSFGVREGYLYSKIFLEGEA